MAKYKGMFKVNGTIGGLNFYDLLGKPLIREAGGGFDGEAIKTKPSMIRVRENYSEFGNCSRVNKVFRLSLRPFYYNYKFPLFHSRLMTLFTGMKALDSESKRGERLVYKGLETEEGKRMLVNFTYTPECNPKTIMPIKFDMNWNTYTLTLPKFDITQVPFITGATHIALQFGVLDFNFESLDHALHLAMPLMLPKDFPDTSLSLTPNSLPTRLGIEQAVLGIRYYQEVDGAMYLLNAKNGVGISVFSVKN